MKSDTLEFVVRDLEASIPGGIPVEVNGRRFESGRIVIGLDDEAPDGPSKGTLDYRRGRAEVCFRVRVEFPEIAEALRLAGVEREDVPAMRGVLRSRGDILPDHSFSLHGTCNLCASEVLGADALEARVLPGT